MAKIARSPEMRERLTSLGAEPAGSTLEHQAIIGAMTPTMALSKLGRHCRLNVGRRGGSALRDDDDCSGRAGRRQRLAGK
jgi:hypothetical protein